MYLILPFVHYKASIIKRSCCSETVYSGISLNVTLKDLENILPAACWWISLLTSAAASVTEMCACQLGLENITALCPWPSVAPLLPSISHLPLGSQMKWKEKNYCWSLNLTAMNSFLQFHTVTIYRYIKKFFFFNKVIYKSQFSRNCLDCTYQNFCCLLCRDNFKYWLWTFSMLWVSSCCTLLSASNLIWLLALTEQTWRAWGLTCSFRPHPEMRVIVGSWPCSERCHVDSAD